MFLQILTSSFFLICRHEQAQEVEEFVEQMAWQECLRFRHFQDVQFNSSSEALSNLGIHSVDTGSLNYLSAFRRHVLPYHFSIG